MNNKYQKSEIIRSDGDFADVYAKVKTPKGIKNQMILTSNPTGPDIFHKNFINNLNNQKNGK